MASYIYPTIPGWFEEVIEVWKSSGKRYFCFSFLWFEPHTLPENDKEEYWLYLYYTESRTEVTELKKVVQYRCRVVQHSTLPIEGEDIDLHDREDSKMYFKCSTIEELRKEDGNYLTLDDFKHINKEKFLPSALRNSIAPVVRVSPALTVQSTLYSLND